MTDTSNMPVYECHKKVHALEVAHVSEFKKRLEMANLIRTITFVDGSSRDITDQVFRRTLPEPGWFYIVYEDGYESFSPGETFKSGYKLIDDRTFADIKRGLRVPGKPTDGPVGDGVALTSMAHPGWPEGKEET